MASPLPDAAHLVAVRRLIVVVRVAIAQVHVPCIRGTVLRGRPKVVAWLTYTTDFNYIALHHWQAM